MYQYSFDLIRNSKLQFWSRWYSGDPSGDHKLPPQLSYTESIVFLILPLFQAFADKCDAPEQANGRVSFT